LKKKVSRWGDSSGNPVYIFSGVGFHVRYGPRTGHGSILQLEARWFLPVRSNRDVLFLQLSRFRPTYENTTKNCHPRMLMEGSSEQTTKTALNNQVSSNSASAPHSSISSAPVGYIRDVITGILRKRRMMDDFPCKTRQGNRDEVRTKWREERGYIVGY